ncbi:MAG: VCBS repeat-containing protein [Nitrospirota bacterium]
MYKSLAVSMLFVLLALNAPQAVLAAQSPAAVAAASPADTVDRMAGEVLKHFPRAEGKVISADEKTVTVDIGAADGLTAGTEVYLFRSGKPIFHPVTKEILGYRETALGSFIVKEVKDKQATGELKELLVTQIIPGDLARLSTEKTKLVFVPAGGDVNELIQDRLLNILRDSGRFDMLGIGELPKDAGKKEITGLAKDKGAEDVVTLSTSPTKRQDRTTVDIKLYASDGSVVENLSSLVDSTSDVYKEKEMDIALVTADRRDFYHMDELPYRATHFAAGNITGDGKTELAISTGRRIIIYRLEKSVLRELWREPDALPAEHLDVECADIDGDGRDEVYVTAYGEGRAASYVIKYDGSNFKRVFGPEPVLFRVLDMPDGKKKLLTTTVGMDAPYSGMIYDTVWKDGALVRRGAFSLPSKIKDPYGFAVMEIAGKDKHGKNIKVPAYVWIDDADYIQVLDGKGKKLWKSSERFGGYDNFFEVDEKKLAFPGADNRGKVKGRVIIRTGPEGEKEIVITKNIPMTNAIRRWHGYSGAEIYSMTWNGTGLDQNWSIKNIEGYLADICVGGVSNNGREEIAIITDPTFKIEHKSKTLPMGGANSLKSFLEDKSKLLIYKVPQR